MLDALLAQLLHHGAGGAEVEAGLVVGGLEQFPQQGFQHAHAVVLQILGQVGVVTGDERIALRLRQPDAAQAEHGRVHHMHQIGLELLEGLRHSGAGQGQLQLRIEGQRHGRHPHHPRTHVLGRSALRAEDQHLIPQLHQVLHRLGQAGHNPVDLGQEGLGEEGDLQGSGAAGGRAGSGSLDQDVWIRRSGWPGPGWWSRPTRRGSGCGRTGQPSGGPHPPLRPSDRRRGWWG